MSMTRFPLLSLLVLAACGDDPELLTVPECIAIATSSQPATVTTSTLFGSPSDVIFSVDPTAGHVCTLANDEWPPTIRCGDVTLAPPRDCDPAVPAADADLK